MSAARDSGADRPTLEAPPFSAVPVDYGYRVTWHPGKDVVKKALVRAATDDGVHILQHIRTITTRQRGETSAEIDEQPTLADLPTGVVAALRGEGLQLAEVHDV